MKFYGVILLEKIVGEKCHENLWWKFVGEISLRILLGKFIEEIFG